MSEDKKVSLPTKDEATAKRRLGAELHKRDVIFEDMRARRHLTDRDKAAAVWAHYETKLNEDAEKRRSTPTDTDLDRKAVIVWLRIDRGEIRSDDMVSMINGYANLELLKRARQDDAILRSCRLTARKRDLATGRYVLVEQDVRHFIKRHQLLVDDGSKHFRELSALMMREPPRLCRRPQLVRSRVYDKQNDEQIFS